MIGQGVARSRAIASGERPPQHVEECFRNDPFTTITGDDIKRRLKWVRATGNDLSRQIKAFSAAMERNKRNEKLSRLSSPAQ